jgi:hypothetical protein
MPEELGLPLTEVISITGGLVIAPVSWLDCRGRIPRGYKRRYNLGEHTACFLSTQSFPRTIFCSISSALCLMCCVTDEVQVR